MRKKYSVNCWKAKYVNRIRKELSVINSYYVYEHIRNDNGNSFYVGKGHGDRAWIKHRNEKHDKIANEYGMSVRIIYNNLTEEEAFEKENEVITRYINSGYGIDIKGLEGDDEEKFLTNQTFGGAGSVGISNPMYNVSPKERMNSFQYEVWLNKTRTRLESQVGDKNPNWKNDTLRKKLENNPELKNIYYSRKGSQNGRSKKIELYDLSKNYIRTFDFIGECASYVKEVIGAKGGIDSIRANIKHYSDLNKPFLKHYYKII